jgi:hypothetical protein
MSAARVLVEQPQDLIVVSEAPVRRIAVPEKVKDREGLFIVSIAIVIALTVTVVVIGSILIALALRGSGVMESLSTSLLQPSC